MGWRHLFIGQSMEKLAEALTGVLGDELAVSKVVLLVIVFACVDNTICDCGQFIHRK